jgi:hypothetical protein
MVIFDPAPIGVAAEGMVVGNDFSCYIIVARAGKTNIVDLKKKFAEYPLLKTKTLGAVINYASLDTKMKYYKNSKYY